MPTICPGCGAPAVPRTIPGNRRRWCSEACRVRAHRRRKTGPPPRGEEKPCAACGAIFTRPPGRKASYCSDVCRKRGATARRAELREREAQKRAVSAELRAAQAALDEARAVLRGAARASLPIMEARVHEARDLLSALDAKTP